MLDYRFPLGIAKGEYFCNRVNETQALIHNIGSGVHTVLISPRRYGKTSLAYRAINQCGRVYAVVDLFMATDRHDLEHAIIKGVNDIISQVTGVTEKLLNSIKGYIQFLKPSLEVGADGFKLSLEPTSSGKVTESICEALKILDQVLRKKKQKCVLLIDEFQEVEVVAKNQGIEGAIRHVAQETNFLSLIFSGSKRTMLKSMFNDKNKPLYRLCDEINLERINRKDYYNFVNRFARKKWNNKLADLAFEQLVTLTERHPYYFNALLRLLFESEECPTVNMVESLWESLTHKKRNDLLVETKGLSLTEKKLLVAIANGINTELTGKNFLARSRLASSSVIRGLEQLVKEDVIEKQGNNYMMIDPLLKTVIKQLQRF